ncbi:MAG TPA: M3 family metallopeptidase [Gammaproteobacteria bacterium]|nr:M3 family metallopeptidase [Gammaproteobacteria bacterium]
MRRDPHQTPAPHMNDNPLLAPDGLPRFSEIRAEHIEPAVDTVLAENRARITQLEAGGAPDWDDFIEPLETLGDRLHRAWSPAAHLNAVMNTPAIRAAYNACLPKISDYDTELGQNGVLQKQYATLKNGAAWQAYTAAQRKLIDDALRDFRLAGVDLPAEKKNRFRDIMQRLSKLETKFEENLLDATQGWVKQVTNAAQLAGLPATAVTRARHEAETRKLEGWVFTLDYPSYAAVITYADDRSLREEMYRAYVTRSSDQGPDAERWDNSQNMREILGLRTQAARLTGFKSYADYSLASKMLHTQEEVLGFLTDLVHRCRPAGQREYAELQEYACNRDRLAELAAWDLGYYSEKLRERRFAISDEMLKPYFPVTRVRDGLFSVVRRLYGISLREVAGADVWHPDVALYAIEDDTGRLRGRLYLDLYTRPGKRSGAWMDDCLSRRKTAHGIQIPAAYLTCNFAPPLDGMPSLLTHDEVVTLFHEFGHCLHHLLTQVDYPSVAGINGVAWDAVELPSQFHENFAWTREGLALVSGHYQTGEPLPDALFQRMLAARHFQSALFMLRQLEFGLLDFRLHMQANEHPDENFIGATLAAVRREVSVTPVPEWNRFAHSFSHIFAGGYAAGYYSYLWAEVLAADAYSAFEEAGVFDRVTGKRFMDTILAQGGSREAMELFTEFRGRAPVLGPFLRLNGIAA